MATEKTKKPVKKGKKTPVASAAAPANATAPTTVPPELLKAVPPGWTLRELQAKALVQAYEALRKPENKFVVLEAPPGCHAAGQLILMATGQTKKVEDVEVGDSLMGWNGTPRVVLALSRGVHAMADITPVKGDPFTVTTNHILTLKRSPQNKARPSTRKDCLDGEVVDVSVDDYVKWSANRKHRFKLMRVGVHSFVGEETKLPIDPYFIGVLLGDGALQHGVAVHKRDVEIRHEVERQAKIWGLRCRVGKDEDSYFIVGDAHGGGTKNPLTEALRTLNLYGTESGTKFVPTPYKTSPRSSRLQLLAGLMDTDGSVAQGGFDFISKSKTLAEDTAFVARSVGLAAYVKECRKSDQHGTWGTYHRVSISGDCSVVPTRIKRKKAPKRAQKKSVNVTGFKVGPAPSAPFFGFTLDGDGRFLLGDFTVTHNTGKTLLALTLGRAMGPAAFITSTVQLQEQYLHDFEKQGLRVLKGRRNYRCPRANDNCDIGAKLKLGCEEACPYTIAKKAALASPLLTANYHSFWRHMPIGMEDSETRELVNTRKLVVNDEAHNVENVVMSLSSVTVRLSDVPVTLPELPKEPKDPEPYYKWMEKALPTIDALAKQLEREQRHEDFDKVSELAMRLRLVLAAHAGMTLQEDGTRRPDPSSATEYIVERGVNPNGSLDENWFTVQPLHVRHIAKRLWKHFPKALFMSATILNALEFCKSLGLNPDDGEFVQIKESFPPENRPIMLGSLDMSYKSRDTSWPHMVRMVEALLDHHATQKGLILTSSNVMLNHLMKHLSPIHRQRLIPAFGEDRMEKYQEHLKSRMPSVLIASGYWEGADLKDDSSRFQIIPSVPRAMFSGQIAARAAIEPGWYSWLTWVKMIQGLGRSVRTPTDEAITYVLDADFQRELDKKFSLIPDWVRVAVKKGN